MRTKAALSLFCPDVNIIVYELLRQADRKGHKKAAVIDGSAYPGIAFSAIVIEVAAPGTTAFYTIRYYIRPL